MRKTELLSGRVKKLTGTNLDSNRYNFLDLKNAEPDAGFPAQTNSLFASTSTGTRSWLSTNSSLSGLSVNAGALVVNEDTVAVDTPRWSAIDFNVAFLRNMVFPSGRDGDIGKDD